MFGDFTYWFEHYVYYQLRSSSVSSSALEKEHLNIQINR